MEVRKALLLRKLNTLCRGCAACVDMDWGVLGLTAEHRGALIFDKAPLGVLSCTYICRCCNVYVHVCVHRWMDVCLQAHVLLFPYVRMYVGVCSNGCAHMNACVHTCMLVCVLTCVHTS